MWLKNIFRLECMYETQISCLDLGPIPKIAHCEYANIKN